MIRTFVIKAEPQGKARPRFARTRNGVVTFTPQKTKDFEEVVRAAYLEKYSKLGLDPIDKAVQVSIRAKFTIPKSWNKKKREQALKGYLYPTKKPDVDNIAKAICDALNGLAYKDDSQVVELILKKGYAEEGYMAVYIQEVE